MQPYDFGVGVPLAIHWPGQPGGRKLEDFCQSDGSCSHGAGVGRVDVPSVMTGKSLVPQLQSEASGWIDPFQKLGGHRKSAMSLPRDQAM